MTSGMSVLLWYSDLMRLLLRITSERLNHMQGTTKTEPVGTRVYDATQTVQTQTQTKQSKHSNCT
jgi:hypothetical protein